MNKIRVCLHHDCMSTGASTHHVSNLAKYLNQDEFEVFLATTDPQGPMFSSVSKKFNKNNIFIYQYAHNTQGWQTVLNKYPDAPDKHPLYEFLEQNSIDILQDHTGGELMFPFNSSKIKCKKVEVNIWGGQTNNVDKTLLISHGLYDDFCQKASASQIAKAEVVPFAVDYSLTETDLRNELNIDQDVIVTGRTSNTYAGDTINFEAFKQLELKIPNVLFLAPNCGNCNLRLIKKLGIKNIKILPIITSRFRMSQYLNTLDFVSHDRGETFGCAVAEPMIHGKPVITSSWCDKKYHRLSAQEELIDDINYCCTGNNSALRVRQFTEKMENLCQRGREYCKLEGKAFQQRAEKFAAPHVTKQYEKIYKEIIKQ